MSQQNAAEAGSAEFASPLSAIVSSAMDAIVCIDEQQRIVLLNPAAERMFGVSAQEALRQRIGRFLGSQFQTVFDGHIQAFRRKEKGNRQAVGLGVIGGLRANGEEFPVEAFISQVITGGRELFTVILRDITRGTNSERALQESEQRLRLALETGALGFYERDLMTNRITVDSTWRATMGLPEGDPGPDFAAKSILGEDRDRVLDLISRAFEPRLQEIVGADFRIVRPNGEVRWVAGRGRVVFDNSVQPPKALKFMGVLQDITERKSTEIALKETRAQLTQANGDLEKQVEERTASLVDANAELEAFCYSLSHDMRSPLRAIISFTELAMDNSSQKLTEVSRRFLHQVIMAARKLDRLIQDVLAFSRVSRMKVELEPVDAHELLQEIISERVEFQAPAAEVRVEGDLPQVLGHAASLTQCFTNLLSNAVKFVPPGTKPRVRIYGETINDKARIWVEDNGIGIEDSTRAQIFTLFERGREAKGYEGVGAGLAIVSKAVERMGGRVGVESEPGRGCRFWLELKPGKKSPNLNLTGS